MHNLEEAGEERRGEGHCEGTQAGMSVQGELWVTAYLHCEESKKVSKAPKCS